MCGIGIAIHVYSRGASTSHLGEYVDTGSNNSKSEQWNAEEEDRATATDYFKWDFLGVIALSWSLQVEEQLSIANNDNYSNCSSSVLAENDNGNYINQCNSPLLKTLPGNAFDNHSVPGAQSPSEKIKHILSLCFPLVFFTALKSVNRFSALIFCREILQLSDSL